MQTKHDLASDSFGKLLGQGIFKYGKYIGKLARSIVGKVLMVPAGVGLLS